MLKPFPFQQARDNATNPLSLDRTSWPLFSPPKPPPRRWYGRRSNIACARSPSPGSRVSVSSFHRSSPPVSCIHLGFSQQGGLQSIMVTRAMSSSVQAASDPAQLKSAKEDIKVFLRTKFCHPILVRLGWHDAGTYDKTIQEWLQRGGANGSLRFEIEMKHGANAGLVNALKLVQPIKDKYAGIMYADYFS